MTSRSPSIELSGEAAAHYADILDRVPWPTDIEQRLNAALHSACAEIDWWRQLVRLLVSKAPKLRKVVEAKIAVHDGSASHGD